MIKINAILVDDEINARENLRFLLNDFCQQINILAEATNVNEAILLIREHKPQVVFLDVQMPQKSGFKLLEAFKEINFQVIFVTAFDNYAIQAFQVAAIDYLLKPIDISLLKNAVDKLTNNILKENSIKRLNLLKENKTKINKIAIPYKSDYVIVNLCDIYCIEADRMYSKIHLNNNKIFLVSKKLSFCFFIIVIISFLTISFYDLSIIKLWNEIY